MKNCFLLLFVFACSSVSGQVVPLNPDLLRSFYKDWYRPDLQAVIVVDDIDKEEIKSKIENTSDLFPIIQGRNSGLIKSLFLRRDW